MDAADANATDVSGHAAGDVEVQVNPLIHVVAPLAAMVVTMIVRKAVNSAYVRATGRPVPAPHDPRVSFLQAVAWTAVIATTSAVAEVTAYRIVNRIGSTPSAQA